MIKTNVRGRAACTPIRNIETSVVESVLLECKSKEENNSVCQRSKKRARSPDRIICRHELSTLSSINNRRIAVISLFSGCGGLDLGMLLAGLSARQQSTTFPTRDRFLSTLSAHSLFRIVMTVDNFKEANQTHASNGLADKDLHEIRDIRTITHFPPCDMIIGGFPCPGFSVTTDILCGFVPTQRFFLGVFFLTILSGSRKRDRDCSMILEIFCICTIFEPSRRRNREYL